MIHSLLINNYIPCVLRLQILYMASNFTFTSLAHLLIGDVDAVAASNRQVRLGVIVGILECIEILVVH